MKKRGKEHTGVKGRICGACTNIQRGMQETCQDREDSTETKTTTFQTIIRVTIKNMGARGSD
jgi:hypothetical protein